jgi:uncharacterized protein (UPF0147 family)
MAKIWANRLIAGTRTWDEVPASRKPAVKEILEEIAADEDNPDHTRAQEVLDSIEN